LSSNASIVLEAFDEQHQRVPELIARARAAAQPRGSLFPARDDTLHLPGGGGIQVQIRPTVAQLEVIDRITRENGLKSFPEGRRDAERVPARLQGPLTGRDVSPPPETRRSEMTRRASTRDHRRRTRGSINRG
jgi:hypothetical protein